MRFGANSAGRAPWIPTGALSRNTRKTERGAKKFLDRLAVRAAPFALLRNQFGDAELSVGYAAGSNGTSL